MPDKIGKYTIIEQIGRGGMATIFKAHDPVLDRLVALKVISTEITDELRARFFREAQACAQLSHPNIVTVYAMGDDDGQLFIVMELLEGEELRHLIATRRAFSLEDKLSIMIQVCTGLDHAHRKGIVHRDIKPGNIFLLRNGWVKILDFGIAHMANADGLTRAGRIMGTLRYMSPEHARGRVDHRSDIFSVGAVFYELLTMRPPFIGDDALALLAQVEAEDPPAPDQLDPTIPAALAAVVIRAMRKDPAERFPDLARMRSELEEVQRQLVDEAQRLRAVVDGASGHVVDRGAAHAERTGPTTRERFVPTVDEETRLPTEAPAARARPGSDASRPSIPVPETNADVRRSRPRSRRLAVAMIGGLAAIGLGALLLWLARAPSAVSPPPSVTPGEHAALLPPPAPVTPGVAATEPPVAGQPDAAVPPDGEGAATPPATSTAPRMAAIPLTRGQAVHDVMAGRNPAHSVTAAAMKDATRPGRDTVRFRIASSRPGYVYVMVLHGDGSDVELVLLNGVETNNHVEPGRPLTLTAPPWPRKGQGKPPTEFLAMVSDAPRDFSVLGPAAGRGLTSFRLEDRGRHGPARSTPLLAGTVSCASSSPCSESYGAVVFSVDTLSVTAQARPPAPRPVAPAPPSARAHYEPSRRCSDILERASLGEPLTDEEQKTLTRECR